jgi:hypothetical protein
MAKNTEKQEYYERKFLISNSFILPLLSESELIFLLASTRSM